MEYFLYLTSLISNINISGYLGCMFNKADTNGAECGNDYTTY